MTALRRAAIMVVVVVVIVVVVVTFVVVVVVDLVQLGSLTEANGAHCAMPQRQQQQALPTCGNHWD